MKYIMYERLEDKNIDIAKIYVDENDKIKIDIIEKNFNETIILDWINILTDDIKDNNDKLKKVYNEFSNQYIGLRLLKDENKEKDT